jgi:hypothetical protein
MQPSETSKLGVGVDNDSQNSSGENEDKPRKDVKADQLALQLDQEKIDAKHTNF